ncbi:hypothetical protein EVAR_55929_1 [Eumeta japonica]|uniref:Uncharacterized protein n=1 Tax=Eumeta variegata TaxID=151549 RepID=A0A4C1YUD3_EUMVA|nr:hypothetical protein EVAR_55929_1 [Eumeta japonica]
MILTDESPDLFYEFRLNGFGHPIGITARGGRCGRLIETGALHIAYKEQPERRSSASTAFYPDHPTAGLLRFARS